MITNRQVEDSQWRIILTCCGRDNGEVFADTWDEAHAFREGYTSGLAVADHGYSAGDSEPGHRRSAQLIGPLKEAPHA